MFIVMANRGFDKALFKKKFVTRGFNDAVLEQDIQWSLINLLVHGLFGTTLHDCMVASCHNKV